MEYKYTFQKKQIKYVEQSIAISKIRAGYALSHSNGFQFVSDYKSNANVRLEIVRRVFLLLIFFIITIESR